MKPLLTILALIGVAGGAGAASASLVFNVDVSDQVGGNRIFHHVDSVVPIAGIADMPDPEPENWVVDRWDNVIRYDVAFYDMGSAWSNHVENADGSFSFRPGAKTREQLDFVFRAGVKPLVMMSTENMPAPLITGGHTKGFYGYNIRQPNDYEKWKEYLKSTFQWLCDTYGRDEVRTWRFNFGIEADWQAKAIDPKTGKEYGTMRNRREFAKMFDYWLEAGREVVGPNFYGGPYFALITQADLYFEHWATGTNYCTGKVGTPLACVGYSDWYYVSNKEHIGKKSGKVWFRPETARYSPFCDTRDDQNDAHGNAYAGGLMWKYEYLQKLIDKYPSLKHIDISLPETGYLYPGGDGPGAGPVIYADHRGAALYASRLMAYARMPNMRWAFNRWVRCVSESRGGWWPVDLKAAVFHPMQIQKWMEGERQLPVDEAGAAADSANEVRAIASASDDASGLHRVLVAKFNNDFEDASSECVTVKLTGLPPVKTVMVREHLIDATHNNWFSDWRKFREANGIEYKSRKFGPWAKLATHYLPIMNDIYGTIQNKDLPVFEEMAKKYKQVEKLYPTRERIVPVVDGVAEFAFRMTGASAMYIDVEVEPIEAKIALDKTVALKPGKTIRKKIVELEPGKRYVFSVEAKPNVARIDYFAGLNDVECFGKRIAEINRMVTTAAANEKGELEMVLSVPEQESDSDAVVEFSEIRLTQVEWQGRE